MLQDSICYLANHDVCSTCNDTVWRFLESPEFVGSTNRFDIWNTAIICGLIFLIALIILFVLLHASKSEKKNALQQTSAAGADKAVEDIRKQLTALNNRVDKLESAEIDRKDFKEFVLELKAWISKTED